MFANTLTLINLCGIVFDVAWRGVLQMKNGFLEKPTRHTEKAPVDGALLLASLKARRTNFLEDLVIIAAAETPSALD
jgi:hypothetical protein